MRPEPGAGRGCADLFHRRGGVRPARPVRWSRSGSPPTDPIRPHPGPIGGMGEGGRVRTGGCCRP
jgi:hypothetical protein